MQPNAAIFNPSFKTLALSMRRICREKPASAFINCRYLSAGKHRKAQGISIVPVNAKRLSGAAAGAPVNPRLRRSHKDRHRICADRFRACASAGTQSRVKTTTPASAVVGNSYVSDINANTTPADALGQPDPLTVEPVMD